MSAQSEIKRIAGNHAENFNTPEKQRLHAKKEEKRSQEATRRSRFRRRTPSESRSASETANARENGFLAHFQWDESRLAFAFARHSLHSADASCFAYVRYNRVRGDSKTHIGCAANCISCAMASEWSRNDDYEPGTAF